METGHVLRELDEAAPVRGWRVWTLVETAAGLRLGSVIHDAVWDPGRTALALCRRHDDLFAPPAPPHRTPSRVCGCGLHAVRDPVDAWSYLRGRDEPNVIGRILGEVALWGRVVETERGWRAAAAYPVRLYVDDAAVARALAAYEVDVVSAPCESPSSPTCTATPSPSARRSPTWSGTTST
jgi:hypothetical protein